MISEVFFIIVEKRLLVILGPLFHLFLGQSVSWFEVSGDMIKWWLFCWCLPLDLWWRSIVFVLSTCTSGILSEQSISCDD